jgi:hypothetical protein
MNSVKCWVHGKLLLYCLFSGLQLYCYEIMNCPFERRTRYGTSYYIVENKRG